MAPWEAFHSWFKYLSVGNRQLTNWLLHRFAMYFCHRESQNISETTWGFSQSTGFPRRRRSTFSPLARFATQTNQPSSRTGLGANMPQYCSQRMECPSQLAEAGNQG